MFFPIPTFKGLDLFPHGTSINFMRFKGTCLALSIIATLLSVLAIEVIGFNYGVDFTGGSLIEVQAKDGKVDVGELRSTIGDLGLGSVQI